MKTKIDLLKETVIQLNNINQNACDMIVALESKLEKMEKDNSELNDKNSKLFNDYKELTNKYNTTISDFSSAYNTYNTLKATVEKEREKQEERCNKITKLEETKKKLNNELQSEQNKNKDLLSDVDNKKQEIQDLKNKLDNSVSKEIMQNKLKAQEQELERKKNAEINRQVNACRAALKEDPEFIREVKDILRTDSEFIQEVEGSLRTDPEFIKEVKDGLREEMSKEVNGDNNEAYYKDRIKELEDKLFDLKVIERAYENKCVNLSPEDRFKARQQLNQEREEQNKQTNESEVQNDELNKEEQNQTSDKPESQKAFGQIVFENEVKIRAYRNKAEKQGINISEDDKGKADSELSAERYETGIDRDIWEQMVKIKAYENKGIVIDEPDIKNATIELQNEHRAKKQS